MWVAAVVAAAVVESAFVLVDTLSVLGFASLLALAVDSVCEVAYV